MLGGVHPNGIPPSLGTLHDGFGTKKELGVRKSREEVVFFFECFWSMEAVDTFLPEVPSSSRSFAKALESASSPLE